MPIPLILASRSPARLATLRAAGVEPRVEVSNVDEPEVTERAAREFGTLAAEDVPLLLARAKAESVSARLSEVDEPADALILGTDSVLEFDGEVHGKPADAAEAISRWRAMRGSSGVLHSGHWIIDDREEGTGATMGAVASTRVSFADLTDAEIEAYVATGEPLAVAGAFTIDGLGGAYVSGIEGDHHNVVGLSLPLLRELLGELGIAWHELRD